MGRVNEEDKTISITWSADDVLSLRKDLTDDQAWEVLKAVERGHDACCGICWDTLMDQADDMFPNPSYDNSDLEGEN